MLFLKKSATLRDLQIQNSGIATRVFVIHQNNLWGLRLTRMAFLLKIVLAGKVFAFP